MLLQVETGSVIIWKCPSMHHAYAAHWCVTHVHDAALSVTLSQVETGSAITWKYPSVVLKGSYRI
jgi:Fe-S cluster assembly scaffold protein SufB